MPRALTFLLTLLFSLLAGISIPATGRMLDRAYMGSGTAEAGGGKARITGTINKPGASVTVAGRPATVHPQGGFAVEVRELGIAEVRLQEGVADQHVEVEAGRDPDGGWRVEQAAEDFFEIEHFPQRVRITPQLFQVRSLLACGQDRGEEIQVRRGEPVPP